MTCQSNDNTDKDTPILSSLKIAAPCTADWDSMIGTERERFCSSCSLNVYNVSSMSRSEAEQFLADRAGSKVCVQYFRRKDGTILSDNCPKGLRALRDGSKQLIRLASSFLALVISGLTAAQANDPTNTKPGQIERGEPTLAAPAKNKASDSNNGEQRLMGKPSVSGNAVSPIPRKELLQKQVNELAAKPHTNEAAKIELANAYIELAHSQNSCTNFKQAAVEFSQAANLLKKIKSKKLLYANVLLNQATALRQDQQENEAKLLEQEAARITKD